MAIKVVVDDSYKTSTNGIFAVGDVAGGALLRQAINHGNDAVEHVKKHLDSIGKQKSKMKGIYDLIIIGAGPGGISCGLTAKKENLNFIIFEMMEPFQTIREYSEDKPLYDACKEPEKGYIKFELTGKRKLLEMWENLIKEEKLDIRKWEKATAVNKKKDFFEIETEKGKYKSFSIVLATGKREPKKLKVKGEELPKAKYYLKCADDYKGKKILVVGGGNSAAEAAILLSKENKVVLSYRKPSFFRLIEQNQKEIDRLNKEGKIELLFKTIPQEITDKKVILAELDDSGSPTGKCRELENDVVFIYAGFELPEEFLKKMGLEIA